MNISLYIIKKRKILNTNSKSSASLYILIDLDKSNIFINANEISVLLHIIKRIVKSY